ncbi:uncharacterized protein HD556DRAFT_234863 [Suillus plorans]|uniref:MYND-type domain-containing protein n=1 Tax=Suillus plorans TaxID=116603 RepID=A0A9P7IYF0_9AGAM|nr:uncharacterized protein HD556DRAFT_234863 [Suillus plorans]KAG1797696.1 hypothetical protein HD556DRAFT_234863 [Suillus plorans]
MPLTAQERTALKYLPKRIQRSTDGALEGVVHDVRKLYHWVDNSTDVDANMTLLPIFYAHLDPAVIPDQPLPTDDVQKVVILAKLSLMSIVQTCASVRGVLSESLADKMITDALVRRWDTLFPWLQFMYRHFLPFPPRRVPEGFDICDVEVVSITTRALSQMAISVAGQHLIQSNMSIQQFIAKLWLYIGKLRDEDLLRHDASFRHDGREGVNDEMTGHVRRIMVGILTACMPVALPAPFAVPTLHNLLDAMGGYEPFVASALRYIRWFGRKIGDMNNRTTPNYGIMDATCQEELILHRAPSDVVTALLQTWPVLTGVRVKSSTETSTEKRCTMILEDTFDYIDVILRQSEACIPALCQVLDAGFIQLVLQAGFRCPQMASGVLKLIPRFLMYHKVLHHFQKVMEQTANNMARFGPQAKKDDEVQQTWILVQQAARQILNVCRKTSPLPFYEQKCANLQCPYDNNRPPHYRCCGCFVARYCSRGCQRTDWKSRHRTACPVLHSAGGFDGSKCIRGSLPLIMLVETFNYSLYADRIQEAMEQARKDYPEDIERLVLETDLSAYPVTFSARPVEQYADIFDPRFDPAMLKELRGLPGKHLLMALKLRAGREECIVLSPRVGLTLAFQWPAAREEEAVLSAVQEALVSRLAVGPGNVIKRGDGFKVVEYRQPPITQPI